MKKTKRIRPGLATGLALALLLGSAAHAESMRCGSHIISSDQTHGMGKYEVLKRCGEPSERHGNTWIYDEPGKEQRILHFDADGMLSAIRTGRENFDQAGRTGNPQ